jgi:hypothetical protein
MLEMMKELRLGGGAEKGIRGAQRWGKEAGEGSDEEGDARYTPSPYCFPPAELVWSMQM